MTTSTTLPGGTRALGDLRVTRFGYGAMQLAGPGVMGPPRDRDGALAVLRAAVDLGITHIDTSGAYGPGVVNTLIREALHPYGSDLRIATKVGARRDADGGWPVSREPADLRRQVEEDLVALGRDALDVVDLRMGDASGPQPGSLAEPFAALVDMRREGSIREVGLSNVTADQVAEARAIAPIACVQNMYNLATRHDDALIDALAADGIAYVPFFPLGGFTPLQSDALSSVAARLDATPMAVALAWLLQRSPAILLIPGTSSAAHLRENVEGAGLALSAEDVEELDAIGA